MRGLILRSLLTRSVPFIAALCACRLDAAEAPIGKTNPPPWGEPAGGLRMRLRVPAEDEYRRRATLPLTLELQNIADRPIPLERLGIDVDAEATDEAGSRLTVKPLIDISPWEGRTDTLVPDAVIRWTVWFDRLRFAKSPRAGSTMRVRFRLPMRAGAPSESSRDTPLLEVLTNTVTIRIRDSFPSLPGEGDIIGQWASLRGFTYREHLGHGHYRGIQIDDGGRVQIVRAKYWNTDMPPVGRMETVLGREHLDKLARVLHGHDIWRLASLREEIAVPDEGEIDLAIVSLSASLIGTYPTHVVEAQPALVALRAEMRNIMAVVVAAAKADNEGWGEPVQGVQCRLQADKPEWKAAETVTLKAGVRNRGFRELRVAQAEQLCELEVDGVGYRWTGEIALGSSWFPPGRAYSGIPVATGPNWQSKTDRRPLRLSPGKHTLRIVFIASPTDLHEGAEVRAVSNPVQIEIVVAP